jgi:hypothetical protein
MRVRYFIAVLAVASTGVAGFLNPSAASVLPVVVSATGSASCASPPDSPDATVANRDRFVDLWYDRFSDNAWLEHYTELDEVPADILAEGFHAMGAATKAWLNTCLLEHMLAVGHETPSAEQRATYLTGLNLVIFGKAEMTALRQQLEQDTPAPAGVEQPVAPGMSAEDLDDMEEELVSEPSLTSADQPEVQVSTPSTHSVTAAQPNPLVPTATTSLTPASIISLPVVAFLLKAVDNLLQLISQIQGVLFTLPGLNILSSVFYKVCAESPTMTLKCSISLPIGVPIPADVTGDNFPDVLAGLVPLTNFVDVGARFQVQRLSNSGALPAHVFAVYDTPIVKKRIQVGFDGRASTLGFNNTATFTLKNAVSALTGDIQVAANVKTSHPGATESLTFAVKTLVGGSIGVPPTEADPLTAAVQMSPFPENFDVNARLIHTANRDQDIFNVASSTPTKVNAVIDQATTTTTPKSNRRFTAEVDKLPTSVTVDLVRNGDTQSIDYTGSAPINSVKASDKATPDVSHPGSFTESIYEVKGVPTNVSVDLKGAEDITYSASAKIPEVSFSTKTLADNVLQNQITAKAHQIPKAVHVTNLTTADQTAFTYDADSSLQDVELSMYDLNDDKTNLVAKATGIPTQMAFTQTKSTGVYDFAANAGITSIEASLTRAGGMLLPMAGDHATVYKRGDALGLDFKLSGFKSAHFDGSEDTTVALGLSPGGQSFDAVADLDDPDVLAKVHVAQLPANLAVTISPSAQNVDYTASSVIPSITGSFLKRDTGDELGIEIQNIPTSVDLLFDGTGSTIGWDASGPTGLVSADAHLTPDTLGGTRSFDASVDITSIPSQWDASWANGNVLFEAPAPGIGSVDVKVTNHGAYHTLAGDHLSAFFHEPSGDLDASLHISNLQKAAFTKLTGADGGGFEAGLKMGNHGLFSFAADVTASSGVVKANGSFSNLPADLTLRSDGGRITYNGDSNPDLDVFVQAGESAAALAATPTPNHVHGVSVRDGASGADHAIKAKLYLTGLPTSLDLNSPAGIYKVGGYHPSIATLVVDAVLTTIAPEPVNLQLQQDVPTANPIDFQFGPFTSETVGGVHNLSLDYTSSEELGQLTAEVIYGNTDDAKLTISQIPKRINVDAAFGAAQKSVNIDMDGPITEITAAYKKAGATDFAASVRLNDVPKWVNILIGRATGSDGTTDITAPDFTLTAATTGLDIHATVAAEITDPVDANAAASLLVEDMGSTVTGALNGKSLHVTSSPATGKFLLSASGEVNVHADLGFEESIFKNVGTLDVHVDIIQVTVGFQNATDLILDLGITTGLRGDFSNFSFGLDTDTEIEVHDTLSVYIDWPDPLGSTDWEVASLNGTVDFDNLIEAWHVNSNTWGEFASLSLFGCGAHLDLIPGPGFNTSSSNTLSLPAPPPGENGLPSAWLITPDVRVFDLSLPDWAMDIVAYFATPYDSDWDVRIGC